MPIVYPRLSGSIRIRLCDPKHRLEVEFTVTTYNALLDVCARSGEIARAEPLLKDMADQGGADWSISCQLFDMDRYFSML